jgi:enamine deaminase RidA (YjgF/YER057c/UK114 family)
VARVYSPAIRIIGNNHPEGNAMRRTVALIVPCILLLFVALAAVQAQGGGIQYLNNPGRTDDNPYSNLVVAGNTVYLAGSIGVDPETNMVPDDVEEEVRLVLDGMKARLERVGMSMDDLVSVQVFCPDLTLYDTFNDIYRTYFTDHFPARAFIGSGPLLVGGHFEVMGTAIRQ